MYDKSYHGQRPLQPSVALISFSLSALERVLGGTSAA